MTFVRTLFGGLIFLLLLAGVFWLVFSNAQPTLPLRLEGLEAINHAVPNPFAPVWGTPLELAFGIWMLIAATLGLLIGLIAGWFMAGGTRQAARQESRRAKKMEKDLKTVQGESQAAKSEADALKDALKLENKGKEGQVAGSKTHIAAAGQVKQITSE